MAEHVPEDGERALKRNGQEWLQHYPGATACCPSRATLYTGQYPTLTGCTQTTGCAKESFDPDVFWLTDNVPTMGDYFKAAGYQSYWKGKWHFANQSPTEGGTHEYLNSYNADGSPNPEAVQFYLDLNVYGDLGFDGWVGPEPHGSSPLNSGSSSTNMPITGRDIVYAEEAVALIQRLDEQPRNDDPWLIISSMVNPHDITLFGIQTWLSARAVEGGHVNPCLDLPDFEFRVDPTVPALANLYDNSLFVPSLQEDLASKPQAQESYRDSYHLFLSGIPNIDKYERFYYPLVKLADEMFGKVYSALKASRFFEDTIVIFLSDHGDLLGSHGYMHQKWHTAYQEMLHTPLIFSNPRLFPTGHSISAVTSHVDILPTMLGLAGLDQDELREQLAPFHTDTQPLVGRDLSPVLLGRENANNVTDPVYFMTDDEVSRGLDQNNWTGFPYNSIIQPNHLSTILTWVDGSLWRLTEYFDTPQFWSDPGDIGCAKDIVNPQFPSNVPEGDHVYTVTQTVKTTPQPSEFEMYNISADPTELNNLYGNAAFSGTQAVLTDMLNQQSCEKRLQPSQPPWTAPPPGAKLCT